MSVVATSCNKVAVMYAGEIMELGYVKDVLKKPMHPYTKGLMASFPSLKGKKEKLQSIGGFLPDLSKKYEGCIFAPRCSSAIDICQKKPPVIEMENGRTVRCHLYGGER